LIIPEVAPSKDGGQQNYADNGYFSMLATFRCLNPPDFLMFSSDAVDGSSTGIAMCQSAVVIQDRE
jgi:hypothetical protein